MKRVYLGGTKGGSGKTTAAHLFSLGAILCKEPSSYVLTDPRRRLKTEGRPYGVQDGRDPVELAQIIAASYSVKNGWLFIDGGGNRPAFDIEMSREADLCLIPFKASEEDLETVAQDLQDMPHAVAWPNAWSTNKKAQDAAQYMIESLKKAFPLRVISQPVYFVNSSAELLGASLENPSTPVRNAARRAFAMLSDLYDEHRIEPQETHAAMSEASA